MSDDLVKRLMQYGRPGSRGANHPQSVACREAADRIAELEAEVARLRAALEGE